MYKTANGFEIKEGERVSFVAVTGEKGHGTYSMTKESTGSHLIMGPSVTVDNGDGTFSSKTVEYLWASEMEALADRSELYAF